jgi:tetratricopeptide (TPR) repeat protein
MIKILKSILLFPLDLIYLTADAWIMTVRFVKSKVRRERDQRCHFCQGEDHSEANHVVRAVLKYNNGWLVKWLSPCIRFKNEGGKRIARCRREGGYTKVSPLTPLVAIFMVFFWVGGTLSILRAASSEPEHFWSNFVTFFNPSRTLGRTDETDFLELGDVRLNPERAERYFLSGVRHFDQLNYNNAQVDFKIAIQSNPTDPKLHFHLARSLLALGQIVQGEASIRRTLELDENHFEALLINAELLERRENRAEALTFARRALNVDPENLRAIRMNAALEAGRGNTETVRVLMDQLLERDSETPATLSFLGRLELSLFQNQDAARELIEKSLEIDPDHIDGLLAMIPLYAQAQDIDAVDRALEHVLSIQPDHLQANQLRAEMMLSRFGLGVGLRHYESLLNRFGGDLGIRLRYAELLLQGGRISEGRRLAQQLTSSRVPNIERSAHWMLAQLYSQLRMFDEAADHARRALQITPDARNIQGFLAQAHLQAGRAGEAQLVLESAMAQHPNDFGFISLYSQVLVNLGETRRAISFLTQVLDENPEADVIRLRRAEIRMQSEFWRDSLADIRLLQEKYPERPELANNLAFILARKQQDLDLAYSLMVPLREQFPENPVILDTYAYVLSAKGQYERAMPIFEKALQQAGGNPAIRFHYAQALAATGRHLEARRNLEAALILDPDFSQADEARNLLNQLEQGDLS